MLTSNNSNFDDARSGGGGAARIRPLFDADVITVEALPATVDAQLYPEE
jgi:hypothetical protein